MPRFFLPCAEWSELDPCLREDEARHCTQVHRCSAGQQIQLLDGAGRTGTAEIISTTRHEVHLKLLHTQQHPKPTPHITLCAAITKGDSYEWLLEKAVELGANTILPVITERVIVRLSGADAQRKQQKWQRLLQEACKQCGQPWMPQVLEPMSLQQTLAQLPTTTQRLCAALTASAQQLSPQQLSQQVDKALLIGPEGDFTSAEYDAIERSGWMPWTLGSLTLRSETAAIHALSLITYHTRHTL